MKKIADIIKELIKIVDLLNKLAIGVISLLGWLLIAIELIT